MLMDNIGTFIMEVLLLGQDKVTLDLYMVMEQTLPQTIRLHLLVVVIFYLATIVIKTLVLMVQDGKILTLTFHMYLIA